MVLIGGVARAFDQNMVSEAVSRKLEPMAKVQAFTQVVLHKDAGWTGAGSNGPLHVQGVQATPLHLMV